MTPYEEVQERLRSRPRFWTVTGAAGFVGSHLVEALLKLNQRVLGLDNHSAGQRANLAQVKEAVSETQWRGFRFLEGDIRNPEICRRACRAADYVLHQAALGGTQRSIDQPVGVHDANLTGFLNVLVAARDAGVARFVYASSGAVGTDDPAASPLDPAAGRALSPYAATKYMNELYAEVFANCYAFDSVGLRYFNLYGPRQEGEGARAAVVPKWITAMIRREPVFVDGDGRTARDFCHVEDVVQANLLAATAEEPAAVNQVYNVAAGRETTLIQLFETIRDLLAPRYPQVRGLRPVHRAVRRSSAPAAPADIAAAVRRLGYRPLRSLEEGLAATVGWYLARATHLASAGVPALSPLGGKVGHYA